MNAADLDAARSEYFAYLAAEGRAALAADAARAARRAAYASYRAALEGDDDAHAYYRAALAAGVAS